MALEITARALTERHHKGMYLHLYSGGPQWEYHDKGEPREGWFLVTYIGESIFGSLDGRIHVSVNGRGPHYRVSFARADEVRLSYEPLL